MRYIDSQTNYILLPSTSSFVESDDFENHEVKKDQNQALNLSINFFYMPLIALLWNLTPTKSPTQNVTSLSAAREYFEDVEDISSALVTP